MFVLHLIQFSPFIVILLLHAAHAICHDVYCENEMLLNVPECICMRHAVTDSKLYHGEKYHIIESMINSFTWQMNLTVRNLQKGDFGQYVCSSENALGKSDAPIRLQGKRNDRKINFFPLSLPTH